MFITESKLLKHIDHNKIQLQLNEDTIQCTTTALAFLHNYSMQISEVHVAHMHMMPLLKSNVGEDPAQVSYTVSNCIRWGSNQHSPHNRLTALTTWSLCHCNILPGVCGFSIEIGIVGVKYYGFGVALTCNGCRWFALSKSHYIKSGDYPCDSQQISPTDTQAGVIKRTSIVMEVALIKVIPCKMYMYMIIRKRHF